MNKAEIRAAVRTITELDQTDVDDPTMDLYIRDGFDRVISLERRWPFYEATATFNTVAGQRGYTLAAIGDFREVTSLLNTTSGIRLQLISYDQAEQAFIADTADPQSVPYYFSQWGESVQLWPKPDSVYSMTVRGYRTPTAWYDSESTEIDADERLHRSLIYFVVAQLYQLQEDAEMSAFYRATFEEAVRLAKADIMRAPAYVPLVLSGGDPFWRGR